MTASGADPEAWGELSAPMQALTERQRKFVIATATYNDLSHFASDCIRRPTNRQRQAASTKRARLIARPVSELRSVTNAQFRS